MQLLRCKCKNVSDVRNRNTRTDRRGEVDVVNDTVMQVRLDEAENGWGEESDGEEN